MALGGLLAAFAATAPVAAQGSGDSGPMCAEAICFEHGQTDYLEGSRVRLYFNNTPIGFRDVVVACAQCPIPSSYRSVIPDDRELRFPEDFQAPPSEPRYAGEYQVSVLDALGQPQFKRTFKVHVTNAFELDGGVAHIREPITFQASGYASGTTVYFFVYRIGGFGGCTPEAGTGKCFVRRVTTTAYGPAGVASTQWYPTSDLAATLECPESETRICRQFWVEPRGSGKSAALDSSSFKVHPGRAVATWATVGGRIDSSANETLRTFNRTDEINGALFLRYGGRASMYGFDVHPSGQAQLDVGIYRTGGTLGTERIATVKAIYDSWSTAWMFKWVVPKDQPYVGARFFMQLEEAKDRHGNHILASASQTFRIQPLAIEARFIAPPATVERTDPVAFVLDLHYNDGTFFTPSDATGPLEACLVPTTASPSPSPCLGRPKITALHVTNGTWKFPLRFDVGDNRLETFRLVMAGNVTDKTGKDAEAANHVRANQTPVFQVVPATLRVTLETTVMGESVPPNGTLERGDTVNVLLTVTYPDGSPFNVTRNFGQTHIPLSVVQRNRAGGTTGAFTLNLTSIDGRGPQWFGRFDIPLLGNDAPEGEWLITAHLKDVEPTPNGAQVKFERSVRTAVLRVVPELLTPRSALAGQDVVTYTFRLLYPNGLVATPQELSLDVRVDVLTFDRGAPSGISATLVAVPDAGSSTWTVTWKSPRTVPLTSHVFSVRGSDRYGNIINATTLSPPFDLYVEVSTREVLTQPATSVERGHSAYVLFKGVQGDTGDGSTGRPRIEVQELTPSGEWMPKILDVYGLNESIPVDHLGIWKTTRGTTEGTFRFAFYGRSHNRAFLEGYSEPFNVTPTTLQREVVRAPELINAKGSVIHVSFERQAGDGLGYVDIYRGIARIGQAKFERAHTDNWTFSWSVPFTMDTGTYTFHYRSQDAYRNTLRAISPAFLVADTGLTSEIRLRPPTTVARGETAKFSFQIYYPDGQTLMRPPDGTPTVTLLNGSGMVQELTPVFNSSLWEVTWVPDMQMPLGDYTFSVTGSDRFDSPITPLETRPVTVTSGTFQRNFTTAPQADYPRYAELRAAVEAEVQDAFVSFTLGYLDRYHVPEDEVARAKPIPTATLNYTWNPALGRYDITFTFPGDLPLGYYVVDMKGLDRDGNTVHARSKAIQVKPATLRLIVDSQTPTTWAAESTTTVRFLVQYGDGRPMTEADGTPQAAIYWNNQPLKETITLTHEGDGWWVASWTAPPILPEGRYYMNVGGQDANGNLIDAFRAGNTEVTGNTWEKIFGVPDLGPLLALGVLGLVALALRGRRPGAR